MPRVLQATPAVGFLLLLSSGCRWDIEDLSQLSASGDGDVSLGGEPGSGGEVSPGTDTGGAAPTGGTSSGGGAAGGSADGGSGSSDGSGGLGGAGSECAPCASGDRCYEGVCQPVRRVFITRGEFASSFGSTANADQNCQSAAEARSLEGTWRAWISDSTTSPTDTFPKDVGPYILVDGTRIADDFADLTDGTLEHPIDLDETGALQPLREIWTGTTIDGFYSGSTCNGWTTTTAAHVATQGVSDYLDAGWTDVYLQFCDRVARLYCFEQ